jgi:hypothetical protein
MDEGENGKRRVERRRGPEQVEALPIVGAIGDVERVRADVQRALRQRRSCGGVVIRLRMDHGRERRQVGEGHGRSP